jgi:hypothetical protein
VSFDANAANAPIQAQKDRTAVTVRWAAHDDDGDDLTYDLYLRGDGEHKWLPLKKGVTEKVYSFDGRLRIQMADTRSRWWSATLRRTRRAMC